MAKRRTDSVLSAIRAAYEALKAGASADLGATATGLRVAELVGLSLRFLGDNCVVQRLKSLVRGKDYVAYSRTKKPAMLSRAINVAAFNPMSGEILQQWAEWSAGQVPGGDLAKTFYTMAIAPCAALELFDRGNKKGPATYFECFIGHLFARELGVNPVKRASLPVQDKMVRLTMDFIFDPGGNRPKVHLPVKMSSRERVVQAWAHQALLDAAFGRGSYRGLLVVHSETKLDLKKREVVEICVPDQWLAYQTLLSRMDRIYYFDMPARYRRLATSFPMMPIRDFADFFAEKEAVLGPLRP